MEMGKMWMKRVFTPSVVTAACLVFAERGFCGEENRIPPVTGILAAETQTATVDGITWTFTVQDGHAILGGGRRTVRAVDSRTSGNITVPSTLGGYPVTAVGNYAFYDCSGLTGVSLPATVTTIGKDAFNGATALASITLPEGLASLGSGAFEECWSLVSVNIPSSLSEIPEAAFSYCESLESLTIPASVASIGADAFWGCDALARVTFLGAPPEMEDCGLFDLDVPPSIACRMAHYLAFCALAAEGQEVFTIDGSGLIPMTDSVAFGAVGLNTRDSETVVFKNTSTGTVTVTGIGYSGFAAAPVETFDDDSAIEGWTFSPANAWGVRGGVLSSCINTASIKGHRYGYLPERYEDFTVQADIRLYGDQDWAVGIVVRASDDFTVGAGSGWRFQIAPNGSYMIVRYVNGSSTTVVGWTDNDAIVENGVNTLAVAVRGSTLAFVINGELVWTGEDSALQGPGRVGFFNYDDDIGNYMTVDNLRIMADVFADGDETSATGSFTFAADFPFSIASGASVEVPLTFQPLKKGPLTTLITLVTPNGDSAAVAASGRGVEDDLSLDEADALAFGGHTGGPFAPSNYVVAVSNSFRRAQSFTVSSPDWLSCSVASASLASGAATNLTFRLRPAAANLATGKYTGEVEIRHVENGHVLSLPATLNAYVTGVPILPDDTLVMTNRPGQVQTRAVAVRNAASSDGALTARLSTVETGRVEAASLSLAALKAARKASGGFRIKSGAEWKPGRILVRFDPERLSFSVNRAGRVAPDYAAAARRLCGGRVLKTYHIVPGLVLVELPDAAADATALETTIRALEADADVVYAEPDYIVRANLAPNDPDYSKLWGMKNTGQSGGSAGADISAEEAWDMTTGSRDVIVGVIDTGVDYTHPDLAANMWRNPGEIPGNGIDDDGNGFVDDVYGINAIEMEGDPADDHYHGTHCAGTIGGVGNNGEGVAGVCWNVSIMALKFLDSGGYGSDGDAITCIEYAIDNGAKVLSNSWGGYGGANQAMIDAIEAAGAAGITFVAAAGNETNDNDDNPSYPASYDCDNIISVVSSDRTDAKSDFSNWGATTCDLAAPGSSIYSCKPGGGYQYLSGTSMATPHVAGAAALLLSRNPAMTPAEVKEALLSTVDKLDSMKGKCVSEGRMNVAEALKTISLWASVSPDTVEGVRPGASASVSVTFDAGRFAPGEYTGILTAKALDEDAASDTMPIKMVVIGDTLSLLTTNGLEAAQGEGGVSSNALSFAFANTGSAPLAWRLASDSDWLVVAQPSGTLAAGVTQTVELSIAGSEQLAAGRYEATLTLENATTGARFFATVVLVVSPGTGPLYVDPVNGDDANHGRLAAYPMRTLQAAANRATAGTEILLADGVYGPVRHTKGVAFTIRGVNGCGKTFIDGGSTNRCATFLADDNWSSYSRPQGTNVTVTGVTLMNGQASDNGYYGGYGGAAFGGRYDACRMVNCQADYSGGAAGYAILNRCEVRGNTAKGSYGGGLYYCHATDSLVADNAMSSGSYGGGAYYGMLNGCTVAGNRMGSGSYPGVYYAAMTNTIVFANSRNGSTDVTQASFNSSQTNVVIMADPGFRAPEDGLYTLTVGSRAINAGRNAAVVNDLDLAGNARIQNDRVDIGCYEGIDDKPYLAGTVQGFGAISAPYAYADGDGNATLTAIETDRRFLGWEDERGVVVATNATLTIQMGTNVVRRVAAVFEELEFYVNAASGDDANAGTDAAAPLRTIMAAVAKAVAGETIHVAAGVYEPIITDGKVVSILGAGIGQSVIDGGGTNRCATLGTSMDGTVLVGFTLRNGYSAWDSETWDGGYGGGAYCGELVNCELTGNYAEYEGGGAYCSRLDSCLVARNVAGADGAGTYYGETWNCSVVGNRTESHDSYSAGAYDGDHYNGAFAGNVNADGEETDGNTGYCENCLVGAANCGMVDPFHGDARPRTGSPLIDAGDDDYVRYPADVTGAERVQGDCVDIGCYEGVRYTGLVALANTYGHGKVEPESILYEAGTSLTFTAVEDGRRFLRWENDWGETIGTDKTLTIQNASEDVNVWAVFETLAIYADASAPADGDGLTPATAVRSLQKAVDLAYDRETVYAASGTYAPIDVRGKRLDILATGGRDETVIDGGGTQRCANLGASGDAGAFLGGFTLCNGFTSSNGAGAYGGVLSNCVVTANMVSNTYSYSSCCGGATYGSDLFDCVVFANTNCGSYAYGGASYSGGAYRTVFSNNTARAVYSAYGGAMNYTQTYDCLFVGNTASGGCIPYSGSLRSGSGYGGAVYDGYHYNATITRNAADGSDNGYGGGAYRGFLYNSIVYGNEADYGEATYNSSTYSGCTDDPRFVDADAGDFRLAPDSRCIDAGNNNYVYTRTDLAGNPRIQGDKVDQGCYERYIPPLEITTEGLPSATRGVAYTAQLEATGGAGEPYAWSSTGGYSTSRSANSFSAVGTAKGWQADDNCWTLSLPFAFPLYGSTYRTAYVSSNGTIAFDGYFQGYSSSLDTLKSRAMIAVIWRDLKTTTGDIYVESSASHVTIRWSAVYYSGNGAVNASATLYPDGRIVLAYGNGNANGGFVGISAGDGANYVSIADASSYANVQDYVVAPASGLPEWLTLSAGGLLSGTPSAAGTNVFSVTVSDAAGRTASREFSLVVREAGGVTVTTPVPVEHVWLDGYSALLATFGGDYEAMGNAQSPGADGGGKTWPDGSPCYVWQDYVAGTSPTNDAVFTATIRMEGTTPVVEWNPDLNEGGRLDVRNYTVWGRTNLTDGVEWTCPTNSGHRFYKVTVDLVF